MVARKPSADTHLRVCIAMMALVALALLLRVLAKAKTKTGVLAEDWLVLLAVACFGAHNGLLLHGTLGPGSGGSSNPGELTPPQWNHFLEYLYGQEILFCLTITTVKISILCFYRRIFTVPSFQRWVFLLGGLCVVWCIVTLFLIIFQCSPVAAAWNIIAQLTGAGECMPASHIVFGSELANVVLDVMILSLPVYMVRRLQLPTRRKWGVSSIFLLGGFVCVTCVVRMYYTFDPNSPTDSPLSLPLAMDWAVVELAAAIVCACLPTYGPLLTALPMLSGSIKGWLQSLRSSLRRSRRSPKGSSYDGGSSVSEGGHTPRHSDPHGDGARPHLPSLALGGGMTMNSTVGEKRSTANRINVENTVEIV